MTDLRVTTKLIRLTEADLETIIEALDAHPTSRGDRLAPQLDRRLSALRNAAPSARR